MILKQALIELHYLPFQDRLIFPPVGKSDQGKQTGGSYAQIIRKDNSGKRKSFRGLEQASGKKNSPMLGEHGAMQKEAAKTVVGYIPQYITTCNKKMNACEKSTKNYQGEMCCR
jgi:hypothetical protein